MTTKKWEYWFRSISESQKAADFKIMGEEGWELAAAYLNVTNIHCIECIFKRPYYDK